jgi:hypothetical protein
VPLLRLRLAGRRLVCVIALPGRSSGRSGRELVLVASPRAPRLRRLTVLRLPDAPAAPPDDAPRAA